jgi:hypothetical protein
VATVALVAFALSGSQPAEPPECPADMVRATDTACIDRYPWPNIEGEKPLLGLSALPEQKDVAAGRVMDVEQLCASVGKRACELDEWVAACRGPGGARYPWGDELPPYIPGEGSGRCNYDKWFRAYDERLVYERDPEHMSWLDQSEPAGSRPECVSASGAWDMLGVEQWVRCPKIGRYGWCLVGRYWAEPYSCEQRITAHAPRWSWYSSTGRCCKDYVE